MSRYPNWRYLIRHPRVTGFWSGPGYAKHHCTLPKMPRKVPAGMIFRCSCGQEWTWQPIR